jgi:hypothetical protein
LSEESIAEHLRRWDINAGFGGNYTEHLDLADRRNRFELSLRDQLRRQEMERRQRMPGGKRKTRRQKRSRKSRRQKKCRKSRRIVNTNYY